MAIKKNLFKGSNLLDINEPSQHFTCNEGVNLQYSPFETGTSVGKAGNRFIVTEYLAPIWNKVLIKSEMNTIKDAYQLDYQLYGLDNMGLTTLISEKRLTEQYENDSVDIPFELTTSACTGSVAKTDDYGAEEDTIEVELPLLTDKYESVQLHVKWYDPLWTKRKGIPFSETLNKTKNYQSYSSASKLYEPVVSYSGEYWNATLKVTYDSDMKSDFSDLRFTGPDGVTLIDHWVITKTDSTSAIIMLMIPWYYGYKDIYTTPYDSSITGTVSGNPNPQYFWMYYGNATASSTSDPTFSGKGYYFDDFTGGCVNHVSENVCTGGASLAATTGYTAHTGGTISVSSEQYTGTRDTYSLKCVTAGTATLEGVYFSLLQLDTGVPYIIQLELFAPLDSVISVNADGSSTTVYGTGDWQTVQLPFTPSGATGKTCSVYTYGSEQQITFYVDQVICVPGSTISDTQYDSQNKDILVWNSNNTAASTHYITESSGNLLFYSPANHAADHELKKYIPECYGNAYEVIIKVSETGYASPGYNGDAGLWYNSSNHTYMYWGENYIRNYYNKAGAGTSSTSITRTDDDPFYLKISVSPKGSSPAITFWRSYNCYDWELFITLIGNSTDLTTDFSTGWIPYLRQFITSTTSAAQSIKYDWIQIIPSMEYQSRYGNYLNHFPSGNFVYDWNGDNYVGGSKTWAPGIGKLDFTVTNGTNAVWDGGTYNCPHLYRTGLPVTETDSFIIEAKITANARTTGAGSMAGLSLCSSGTNVFQIGHYRSSNAADDNKIYAKTIYGGTDYAKGFSSESFDLANGPVYIRIVRDSVKKYIYGDYSYDGINWIRHATESWDNLKTWNKTGIYLKNDGTAACTATIDYFRVYAGAALHGCEGIFTAEQTYTDFPLEGGETTTSYTDDFGDYPYIKVQSTENVTTGTDYSSNTTGFNANAGATLSSSTAAYHSGSRSLKVDTNTTNGCGTFMSSVTVMPGNPLTFSFWIKGTAGRNFLVGVEEYNGAGGAVTSSNTTITLATSNWEQHTYTITTNAATQQAIVFVYQSGTTAQTFYLDDILLISDDEVPDYDTVSSTTGLLTNTREYPYKPLIQGTGYFNYTVSQNYIGVYNQASTQNAAVESTAVGSSPAGWGASAATQVVSNTYAYTGTKSLKVAANGTSNDSFAYADGDTGGIRLSMYTNRWYTASAWIYVPDTVGLNPPHARGLRLVAFYRDSGGVYREHWSARPTKTNEWQKLTVTFYVTNGSSETFVRLYNGFQTNGVAVYYDDFQVHHGFPDTTIGGYVHGGNGSDAKTNTVLFSDTTDNYTVTFDWRPVWQHSTAYFYLWFLRYIDSSNHVRIDTEISGSTVIIRLIERTAGTDSVKSSTTLFGSSTIIPQDTYQFEITDDDKDVTIKFNGSTILRTTYTSTLNSRFKGFGGNQYSTGIWDNIVITDRDTNYNKYGIRLPDTWPRNTPVQVAYKEYGGDYQYSRKFNATQQGSYIVGPNGLDKYIGMKVLISMVGDVTQELTVNEIDYEWEY